MLKILLSPVKAHTNHKTGILCIKMHKNVCFGVYVNFDWTELLCHSDYCMLDITC